MRKKSMDINNDDEIRTPISKKDSVLKIMQTRLQIVEDRLTELAYLLEYDFETLDDSSRTAMLETKLKEQIALKKKQEEDEIRRVQEAEDKRIEEAAQKDLLIRQQKEKEEENKRIKELAAQEELLKIESEREEIAKKEADAEKEKLEAKEEFLEHYLF